MITHVFNCNQCPYLVATVTGGRCAMDSGQSPTLSDERLPRSCPLRTLKDRQVVISVARAVEAENENRKVSEMTELQLVSLVEKAMLELIGKWQTSVVDQVLNDAYAHITKAVNEAVKREVIQQVMVDP